MQWNLKIIEIDGVSLAHFYEEEEKIGEVSFDRTEDFLKFLSILPRNRIKVLDTKVLIERGVPICLTQYGSISITATIRALMDNYSSKEICEMTGFTEKIVNEIYCKLKKGKL
jgi:hypothetical protein